MIVAKTASMSVAAPARRWPPAALERPEILGPILVAPAILYIAIMVGYPFLLALYLAMSDANVAMAMSHRFMFISLLRDRNHCP